jgi:ABC-type Fe3+ transport system substrate-binding protein
MTESTQMQYVNNTRKALIFAAYLAMSVLPLRAQAVDQSLIDAAQKEGRVVWYTTQIIDQLARPLAEAFTRTYGIKVDYVRADSNEVALRLLNEGKAGRVQADVFDGTAAVAALKRDHLVMQWLPPHTKDLPADFYDPEGYWVATNLYVLTLGYNTDAVPANKVPHHFEDLLDPQWKGKIVWNTSHSSSAAPGFIGVVLASMGEEKGRAYLKALSAQNIASLSVAARQVLDQVIAGEYSIALNIFNNHALISAAKGAPSQWQALDNTMATFSVISATAQAPHPHAAKLFIDFAISHEGQAIYRDADYIPIDPAIAPRHPELRPNGVDFKATYFTPERLDANMPKWYALYREYFE